MRESLTVLAALVILCLSVALAAPYFIDWNGQRGWVETHLSQALGEKVSIHGSLDLKLLPTPYLHLQDIEISNESTFAHFKAEDIFLEIAIPPLLRGEVDFIEARLLRPHFTLRQEADGTLLVPQPDHFSGQARFDRIDIEDGRIDIGDPAQSRMLVLDHLDLNAEAGSLSGPFKGDGSASVSSEKTQFRFSTGTREADSLRLKLIADKSATHPRADIDGALSFGQSQIKNSIVASFKGHASFSGLWHGDGHDDIVLPWQVSGPLRVETHKAAMDTFDLRLGDEDHAVNAMGSGELDFSAAPKANLTLRGRQIDIDKLLSGSSEQRLSLTFEHAIKSIIESEPAVFPVAITLDAAAETATLNGETLSDLSTTLVLDPNHPLGLRFDSNLPGHAHLRLDGHFETGSAPRFDGHVDANIPELDHMAAWLAGIVPQEAADLRRLPFHAVEVRGAFNLSRVGFSGRNVNLRSDRSTLAGDLSYTQAVGSQPARVFADLASPSLDLAGGPNLQDILALTKATDLSILFKAHSVKFAGLHQSSGKGTIDTGEIRVKLSKTGDKTTLDDLTVNQANGTNINATGIWIGQSGTLDAKLNVPKLGDISEVLQHFVPDHWLDMLSERTAVLSPLQIDTHAEATVAGAATTPMLTMLTLTGAAGATRFKASVRSDPQAPSISVMAATADAPESGAMLRQLGVRMLPTGGLGRGHIEIKTQGPPSGKPDVTLQAMIAGLNMTFQGQIEPATNDGANWLSATGQAKLTSADLAPLLQATGLAFLDPTARFPLDIFSDLDWRATRLDLRNLKGSFAGTALTGFLTYAPPVGAALDAAKHLTGILDLDKASAASFSELALGTSQPIKGGSLWSSLPFASGLPDPPPTNVTLHAKTLDILPGLSGENAAMQLEIAPDLVTFRDITMKTGGGIATGSVTLRRDGKVASLSGHINVENYELALPSLQARASAAVEISGTGSNPLALIASLSGSGHARFADVTVKRADPSALVHIFADVENDKLNVDEADIEHALTHEFDRGSLGVGTRVFDLAVAGGVLRLTDGGVTAPADSDDRVSIDKLAMSVDLRTAAIDEKLNLSLVALPRDWQGAPPSLTFGFKGPLANPTRTIEAAGFVNALAARAIAREAARIQSYEFDLHERTFFNQRLQLDRRHDEDHAKAEEDARQATEAVRKAEEAAKIEKQRKAEESHREEIRREEIRRKAEAAARAKAALETRPARENPANELQSQQPRPTVDPSTAGRY